MLIVRVAIAQMCFLIQLNGNSYERLDFEFEKSISQMNRKVQNKVETVFIMTAPEFAAINSTIVREIIKNGGDATEFVPEGISLSSDSTD